MFDYYFFKKFFFLTVVLSIFNVCFMLGGGSNAKFKTFSVAEEASLRIGMSKRSWQEIKQIKKLPVKPTSKKKLMAWMQALKSKKHIKKIRKLLQKRISKHKEKQIPTEKISRQSINTTNFDLSDDKITDGTEATSTFCVCANLAFILSGFFLAYYFITNGYQYFEQRDLCYKGYAYGADCKKFF